MESWTKLNKDWDTKNSKDGLLFSNGLDYLEMFKTPIPSLRNKWIVIVNGENKSFKTMEKARDYLKIKMNECLKKLQEVSK